MMIRQLELYWNGSRRLHRHNSLETADDQTHLAAAACEGWLLVEVADGGACAHDVFGLAVALHSLLNQVKQAAQSGMNIQQSVT
jgi:hypothetical protein